MCMQYAQYVLLFLVLVVNSDQFQILQSYSSYSNARSYALLYFYKPSHAGL